MRWLLCRLLGHRWTFETPSTCRRCARVWLFGIDAPPHFRGREVCACVLDGGSCTWTRELNKRWAEGYREMVEEYEPCDPNDPDVAFHVLGKGSMKRKRP